MTKPKFTPDPVPDGLDQPLAEYLARQLNRIEDWWPKDLEARLEALELLVPYKTGVWPIVDYSRVTFTGYEDEATVVQVLEPNILVISLGGSNITTGCYTDQSGGTTGFGVGSSSARMIVRDDPDYLVITNASDLMYSDTGANGDWSLVTAATLGLNNSTTINGVWKGADSYWYVAGKPPGSANGLKVVKAATIDGSWSQVFSDTGQHSNSETNSVISDGDGRVLSVGYDSGTGNTTALYSLDDGATWNETGNLATSASDRGLHAHHVNGQWFITGVKCRIWHCPPGAANFDVGSGWALRYTESNQFESAVDIEYGDGLYLCVQSGSSVQLVSSSNALSWTAQGSFMTSYTESLNYDDNCGWACVSGTTYQYSADGVSWSNQSESWSSLVGVTSWSKSV